MIKKRNHWKLVHLLTIMSVSLLIYLTNQDSILRSHICCLAISLQQMYLGFEANLRSWLICLATVFRAYVLELNSSDRRNLERGKQCLSMYRADWRKPFWKTLGRFAFVFTHDFNSYRMLFVKINKVRISPFKEWKAQELDLSSLWT